MRPHLLDNTQGDSRIECSSTFTDNGAVPLLSNRNGLALDIRRIFDPLKQLFLDFINILGFLDRRRRSGW